jgi:hypothetical protein
MPFDTRSQVIILALGLPKVIDRNGTIAKRENKGGPDRDFQDQITRNENEEKLVKSPTI